jgi:HEXXH motif-containing protein
MLLDLHRLSERDFDALAAGVDGPELAERLRASERSQRRVLLRALLDEARNRRDLAGPLFSVDDAWDLLVRAERRSAAAASAVIDYPLVGLWAAFTLRRLRGLRHDDAPLWVDVGYLHCVAVAAAVRAGLSFQARVPVRRGTVVLPTFGHLRLASRDPWEVADFSVTGEGARLAGRFGAVELADGSIRAQRWPRSRRLTSEANGLRLSVALDDVNPYRHFQHPALPAPVLDSEMARWQRLFDDAWLLLSRDHPEQAQVLAALAEVVIPTVRAGRFLPRSASSGDGFGAVLMSEPDDATQLAATLVHELQHAKLGALLHLVDLCREGDQELFYAPWRDDPRPLGALLQGVFAFFGVTRFWRRARAVHPGDAVGHFEFALWRTAVRDVVETLVTRPELTVRGHRFLLGVSTTLDGWLAEPVPRSAARLAAAVALDHRVGWRLRHLTVSPTAAAALADGFSAGRSVPPDALRVSSRLDRPARTAVTGLEVRSTLIRHLLHQRISPGGPRRSDEPGRLVRGTIAADLDWLAGDAAAAAAGFTATLEARPEDLHAWSGLALAYADLGEPAAVRAFASRPELVRAVHRALAPASSAGPATRADTPTLRLSVARWIGAGLAGWTERPKHPDQP